jgi:starch synthase
MLGGGDVILVPSRFEPCGLTQLYGLAYGCVPVVSRTGGLADTVIDANLAAQRAGAATGVQFDGVRYQTLADALSRAVGLHTQREVWRGLQRAGMKSDFSWARSGKAYAELYASLRVTA